MENLKTSRKRDFQKTQAAASFQTPVGPRSTLGTYELTAYSARQLQQ
jgi:hypothetical protein